MTTPHKQYGEVADLFNLQLQFVFRLQMHSHFEAYRDA